MATTIGAAAGLAGSTGTVGGASGTTLRDGASSGTTLRVGAGCGSKMGVGALLLYIGMRSGVGGFDVIVSSVGGRVRVEVVRLGLCGSVGDTDGAALGLGWSVRQESTYGVSGSVDDGVISACSASWAAAISLVV